MLKEKDAIDISLAFRLYLNLWVFFYRAMLCSAVLLYQVVEI